MVAVSPIPETEWVRMGALVVRTDVNHREHRNLERIKEYVRMLENGTNPPPIEVDRRTNTVSDGILRFFAAKQHAYNTGCKWQDYLLEVVWKEGLPNPDSDPELFAAHSAIANRYNGEPLDRRDVLRILGSILKKHGKEKAREYALQMNETNASFEEWYRSVCPAPPPRMITTKQVAVPGQPPVFVTGEFEMPSAPPEPEREFPNRGALVEKVSRPPGPLSIGEMRSSRPPIISACRNLREAIKEAKGDFTDAERSEMEDAYRVLGLVLNK